MPLTSFTPSLQFLPSAYNVQQVNSSVLLIARNTSYDTSPTYKRDIRLKLGRLIRESWHYSLLPYCKMEKYESIPLELPNDYVSAFNGFALDIGELMLTW